MYIDDKQYQDNVYKRKHVLKVYFDGKEVNSSYILGCERRHILFENNEFCFGGTPAQTVELKIHKEALPETIDRVEIVSGILGKEFPIGQFNVDKIEYDDDSSITLNLIDDMIKFEFNYDTNIFTKGYATLREIAEDICTKGGVEFSSTSFLNEDMKVYVYDNTVSARTFLGYIAEQASAFAMIGRDGKLYFKMIEIPNSLALIKIQMNMNESVLESVIPTRYKDRVSFDFDTEGKLICKIDDTLKEIQDVIMDEDGNVQLLVDTEYYSKTKAIDLPLNLFENYKFSNEFVLSRVRYDNGIDLFEKGVTEFNTLYISQENMYIKEQSQIDKIYDKCDGLDIYSFEGSSIIDPAIEIGDILEIDGKYVLYQGSQKFGGRWKADINIEIMSKQKEETTTKTSTKTMIRRLQSRINEQDGKIEMVAQETDRYNEVISQQNIEIGKIKQSVEQVVDVTNTIEGSNPLKLENCMNGELQYLSIIGNDNLNNIEIVKPTIIRNAQYGLGYNNNSMKLSYNENASMPYTITELEPNTTYYVKSPLIYKNSYNCIGLFTENPFEKTGSTYANRYLGFSTKDALDNPITEERDEVVFTTSDTERYLITCGQDITRVKIIKNYVSTDIRLQIRSEDFNDRNGYVIANLDIVNHQYNTGLGACRSAIITIAPNTEYTVLKSPGERFALGTFIESPKQGQVATNYSSTEEEGYNVTELKITSGPKDNFLVIFFYDDNLVEELDMNAMYETIKVYSHYKTIDLKIESPLLYYDENTYDQFIYDASLENKAKIIRQVGIDEDDSLYPLTSESIEILDIEDIMLCDGTNYIEILNRDKFIHLKAIYVKKNEFTKQFATIYQVKSSIELLSNAIQLLVKETVNKNEIIAELNLEVKNGLGTITINGNRFVLNTDFVKITEDGKAILTGGKIAGMILEAREDLEASFLYQPYTSEGEEKVSGLQIPSSGMGNGNRPFLFAGANSLDDLVNANAIITHIGDGFFKHLNVNGEDGSFYINYASGRKSIEMLSNGLHFYLDNGGNNPFARLMYTYQGIFMYLHDSPSFCIYDSLHNLAFVQFDRYNPDIGETDRIRKGHIATFWGDIDVLGNRLDGLNYTIRVQGWEVLTTGSDERLKKNIKKCKETALEIVKKIPIISFDWKEDSNVKEAGQHIRFGYGAQRTEKIYKDAVYHDTVTDKYQINLLNISSLHTKALQEEDKKTEDLKNIVNKQQKTIDRQQIVIDLLVNKLNCKEEIEKLFTTEKGENDE